MAVNSNKKTIIERKCMVIFFCKYSVIWDNWNSIIKIALMYISLPIRIATLRYTQDDTLASPVSMRHRL
jgi:hypothetical protein